MECKENNLPRSGRENDPMKNQFSYLLLIMLLLLPVTTAQLDTSDLYKHSYLVLDTKIDSSARVEPTSSDWMVEYVLVKLFFKPVADQRLEVLSMKTVPQATQEDGMLVFSYGGKSYFPYELDAEIKTKAVHNLVPLRVEFPIKEVPPAYEEYLSLTESVDFNDPAIRAKAKELAEGESDLYIVVNKAAIWTRDYISYNLSTVNVQASKPASWVLEHREGVCDEITNLFLALMRSLGIPARFVSGIAYTNSPLFDEKWGAHGWAEVYFPNIGWVPFDPTYGQFGWLDPAHIKLKESLDATEPSTKVEWRGRSVDMRLEPLSFEVNVLERGPEVNSGIFIATKPLKERVAFDGYNVIEASVKNDNPYYVTTDVSLAKTEGMTSLSPQSQSVILKPHESGTVYWVVKVDDLKRGFVYTLPVLAYDLRNASGTSSFAVQQDGDLMAEEEAMRYVKKSIAPKKSGSALTIVCTLNETVYIDEKQQIACIIQNKGARALAAEVCRDARCTSLQIGVGESKKAAFPITKTKPGRYVDIVQASAGSDSAETDVVYTLLDRPQVIIKDVELPSSVQFKESFDVTFTIDQSSFARVEGGTTKVLVNGVPVHVWSFTGLAQPVQYRLSMRGADLAAGENIIRVEVTFASGKGTAQQSKEVQIELTDVTIPQRFLLWLNRLGRWIASLF